MTESQNKSLFNNSPTSWGLRGDPKLWEELKIRLNKLPLPSTDEEFVKLLNVLFKDITGMNLIKGENIYVQNFETTGTSSGMVSCDFWNENGFPLLIKNFKKLHE